ncbi:hypothetical protein KC950_01675 [Candidatus Saccharibacteria bacterium]|nr:hypothetical protein [Candidatus Saccharibacteria bacterium]
MTFEMMLVIGIVLVIALVVGFLTYRQIRKRKKSKIFIKRWKEIQKLCAQKDTWPEAIAMADDLLGKALKRKHYKGKNTGERMVAAQKVFSNNDSIWTAHKLSMKIKDDHNIKLKKVDVKNSLLSFGKALKELGVI